MISNGRARIPWWRKFFYSLVMLFFVCGMAELVMRLSDDGESRAKPAVGTRKFVNWLSSLATGKETSRKLYQSDPHLLWRLKPATEFNTVNNHFAPNGEAQSIQISINDEGYRGRPASTSGGKKLRVLCMGDSNFFGYPLDDRDAFPAVLERTIESRLNKRLNERLNKQGVEVINAGCPGYSVVQGWRWYEEKFQDQPYDWLLLSYLNNDAWKQPQADLAAMQRQLPPWIFTYAQRSYCVRWLARQLQPTPDQYVPRVPLETYQEYYIRFLNEADAKGAQVLILDYRAYDEYEQYSRQLRTLSNDEQSLYLMVADLVGEKLKRIKNFQGHELAERVQRRWGAMVQEQPHLWVYAEYNPEHLNEFGTALLAESVSEVLVGKQ